MTITEGVGLASIEPAAGLARLDDGTSLAFGHCVLAAGVGAFPLLQALTQIQEQTLVYAPKIIAIFISLLLFLPLMGGLLGAFMRTIAARISGM